ncbi:hypothetical protein BGZ93_001493 [Podila epicladia]|nr:hypothetical protein BGZ92_003064 [Podila epicladia]KAG0083954.1 hypothetical protein BGZ93_001493 [Podila epicladia]
MASFFGFGSNGNGQLGIGSDEDTSVPIRVEFSQGIIDSIHQHPTCNASFPFHCFAAGGNHTALITQQSRRLFMTGSNKDAESLLAEPSQVFRSHELILGSEPPSQLAHHESPTRWRSVACGWAFTIAVTEPEPRARQQIYAWGSGAFGELGLGPGTTKSGPKAMPITRGAFDLEEGSDNSFEIIKVAAGLRHVLALVKERQTSTDKEPAVRTFLVGWGSNRQGQLGQLLRNKVKDSTDGGELVPFTEKELRGKIMEPTRIQIFKEGATIVDMACGQNHSLILFSDGTVYSSGLDKYGQLGPSTLAQEVSGSASERPRDFRLGFERVVGLPYVDSISCGWNHNAVMDSRAETLAAQRGSIIYMWGRSNHGQLGNGVPYHMIDGTTSSVPSGIVSLRIFSSGEQGGTNGEVKQSAEIVSYSCGSEHTLATTSTGECFAWGWNEHGNCGTGAEDHGQEKPKDVPEPRKIVFDSKDVDSPRTGWVQGGYGSSWVFT